MIANEGIDMKKIILILTLLSFVASSLCGCALTQVFTGEVEKAKYTNDEYHFELIYPSSFWGPDETYLDEDENEVEYSFSNGDDRITLTCLFNKEKNFYDYITKSGFDKKYIAFKTENSFLYDTTSTDSPEYKIVMATKKMIYTLDCTSPDMKSEAFASNMELVDMYFTLYANLPKDNATLSEPISLANGNLSVQVPADCEYTLTPHLDNVPYKFVQVETENEEGETVKQDVQVIDTDKYTGILISNSEYLCAYKAPEAQYAPYKKEQMNSGVASTLTPDHASALFSGLAVEVKLTGAPEHRSKDETTYIISAITCKVGDKMFEGTYSTGYTKAGTCFEYAYVRGQLTEGEEDQFMDVINSAHYK